MLKTPPIIVDSPSARMPSASWRRDSGLSTISPMASMSPVVSVMITRATMIMEKYAARSPTLKSGSPKWNGAGKPNQLS